MKGRKKKTKDGYYSHVPYSIIVIGAWGVVPAFAKLGSLSGGITTMFVNWFAVLALLAVILFQICRKKFTKQDFTSLNYGGLILLGLIWPLGYSLAYFTSIELGSSSMTTIINYFWPIFLLGLITLCAKTNTKRISIFQVKGRTFSKKSWLFVVLAVLAVIFPVLFEKEIYFLAIPIVLAVLAALTQAIYNLVGESLKGSELITTFIISIVTAVGASVYVIFFDILLFKTFILPNIKNLYYLAFIGLISNGVGFWAFLKAAKLSVNLDQAHKNDPKILFLAMMCSIPIVQVIMISLLNVESISIIRWISVFLLGIAIFGIQKFLSKQN